MDIGAGFPASIRGPINGGLYGPASPAPLEYGELCCCKRQDNSTVEAIHRGIDACFSSGHGVGRGLRCRITGAAVTGPPRA